MLWNVPMGGDCGCFGEKSNHLNLNLDTKSPRHFNNITIALRSLLCLASVGSCLYYSIVLTLDEILNFFPICEMVINGYRFQKCKQGLHWSRGERKMEQPSANSDFNTAVLRLQSSFDMILFRSPGRVFRWFSRAVVFVPSCLRPRRRSLETPTLNTKRSTRLL